MFKLNLIAIVTIVTTVSLIAGMVAAPVFAQGNMNISKGSIGMNNSQMSTMAQNASSIVTLGNPVFTERIKPISSNPVVVNGTHGFQTSYSGSGVVKGIDFTGIGTALILPRSNGALDLNGHETITASNGEKATYTFYAIGHTGANGTISDNGALIFHTKSAANLSNVNNLVVIFKNQVDKAGNASTIGWEWK